jgi:hypothetical protein
MTKWQNIRRLVEHPGQAKPLPIVHDAAVATPGIAEGRLVPVLIVDAADRPDVAKLVHAHKYYGQGDADLQWGRLRDAPESVALFVDFQRPGRTFVVLQFEIPKQWVIVDRILKGKGFYLQLGNPGDRFIGNETASRIFVSVPELGFDDEWEKLLVKAVTNDLRLRGLKRQEAARTARDSIALTRQTLDIRMRP